MQRYISLNDDNRYTHLLKLLKSLGGSSSKYNFLITDIEAYHQNKSYNDLFNKEYVFLSSKELLTILEKEDIQFINGIFSAIPDIFSKHEVLQYTLPSINNINLKYYIKPAIQHPLTDIEIACIDSTYFSITFRQEVNQNFLKEYPLVTSSIDGPENYFVKNTNNKPINIAFEFSYYAINKWIPNHTDSLYISEDRFNDFIDKYPYFDKTTRKNKISSFNYYGPNYYNKEQTKDILDNLLKNNCIKDLPIIKFLTKAYQEYNGFYIYGP